MVEDYHFAQVDHHHASLFRYDTTMKARFSQIMGAASALAVCAPQSEALADNLFLKLEGLKGDSVASDHKDEIEIVAFSMGHSRPFVASAGGAGGSAARTDFSDIHLQARMSSVSPKLAELCATGKAIPSAKLSVQTLKASKELADYYQVDLEEVHITSIQTSASDGGSRPAESFTLSFNKITWTYKPSVIDGKPNLPDQKATYNIVENKP